MKAKPWLLYALTTTVLWGIWGAFTGVSAQKGFSDTLVYCVWSITMILPGGVALVRRGWKLEHDRRSIFLGFLIGMLGAGGQMILFYALTIGPAYLIFPIISLSPVVTIIFSYLFLGERTRRLDAIGIILAIVALPMFDFSFGGAGNGNAVGWFLLALSVMFAWGLQGYFMKSANRTMSAEGIFIYMTIFGLVLAPIAYVMTRSPEHVNWGWSGPGLAALIQVLNAIGGLALVHAFRTGRAIVVAPLANAGAPLLAAVLSLAVLGVVPSSLKTLGIILASVAALLLSLSPEENAAKRTPDVVV